MSVILDVQKLILLAFSACSSSNVFWCESDRNVWTVAQDAYWGGLSCIPFNIRCDACPQCYDDSDEVGIQLNEIGIGIEKHSLWHYLSPGGRGGIPYFELGISQCVQFKYNMN